MTRTIFMTAIVAAFGFPAVAGSIQQPVTEPTIAPAAPAPVIDTGGEWGGFYLGAQAGWLDADTDTGLSGDDPAYGLHAGYNHDFGLFVLGGEVDYDFTDVDLGGAAMIDSVLRGKIKAGYDFGPMLAYVTGGVARADTTLGTENGEFYGLGVAYQVTPQWSLSGEVLEHRFDDIGGSGVDTDATTVTARASFRF